MAELTISFIKMKADFSDAIRRSAREASVDPLQAIFDTQSASDSEKRHVLDHAFREKLSSILSNPNNINVSIFENLVRLSIMVSKKDMCNATLPVVLLSDVFESLTLDNCDKLFNFVEESVNIWKEDFFFSSGKNHILRMCNDLLRRLSRSQNTVFCGRILLFLAKFFPFSERSGLNVISEFNMENITEYKATPEENGDIKTSTCDDEAARNKMKLDYNLYCKFWALQDFFRNPNQCYLKILWRTFTSHTTAVLDAFSSYKLEEIGTGEHKKGSHKSEQQYFAKYLTNQKLLELQLSDTNFRRFVLLQFLILFQYLTSTVKFRSDNDELKPEQAEWVKETTVSIYALMVETPPHGAEFAKSVKHILERESHWNTWKNEGCHEFKKPATADSSSPEPIKKRAVKRLGELMKSACDSKRILLGNPELTKLWNQASNNLDACRSKERDFLPSLEMYFEDAITQANPLSMVEEKYKKVNDGNFGWRALRLMARRSPHFFTHSNTQISKLPEYLEMMIKKIAKDLPSGETADELKSEEQDLGGTTQDADEDELLEEAKDGFKDTKEEQENLKDDKMDDDEEVDETPTIALTQELLDSVAKVIAVEWTKVATKLGYKEDEIEYLKGEHDNEIDRCIHLLKIWKQDDEDASAAGLAYTLSGLGLTDAAALLQ
ncbi:THO complex subunit 1 isoform X2 [Cloeon dipterum]|uniref:THO complex subunit 1 isoform X2 n=1 Tax=Cloeon dipterum TaxID=197152 RepID=UPI00321FFC91